MVDERASRASSFRPGPTIQLADGQTWILPAPPRASEWNSAFFGAEYVGVVRAILEAEDVAEERRAELALAIYLLHHNYQFSPADFDRLLGSSEASSGSSGWQQEFHIIVLEYVNNYLAMYAVSCGNGRLTDPPGTFLRMLAWFRNHLLFRWFSFDARRK